MSQPSRAKAARQARRAQRLRERVHRRRESAEQRVIAAAAQAFTVAFERWQAATEPLRDSCPHCGDLVVIEPALGRGKHFSHREPVCLLWLMALEALGAVTNHAHRVGGGG